MISKLRHFSSILVGLSIPFNSLAISVGGFPVSFGFIAVAIYTLLMIPYFKDIFRIGKIYGNYVSIPLYYLILLTIVNFFNWSGQYYTPIFSTSIFLCVFFYYLLLVHSLHDEKAMTYVMNSVGIGCAIMSLLFVLGIGTNFDEVEMRMTMFDENSNELGIYMSIGFSIVLYRFIIMDSLSLRKKRFLFFPFLLSMLALVVATASRTAFITAAMMIAMILLLGSYGKKIYKFFIFIFAGVLILYTVRYLEQQDASILLRLSEVQETGRLSGRNDIWESILPVAKENFIIGVGETGYAVESKLRMGSFHVIGDRIYGVSPHNVLLEVTIYTGVIGLLLLSFYWFRLFVKSWRSYMYTKDLFLLLLLVPVMACLLSGQILHAKWAFIVYAYIIVNDYYRKHKMIYKNKFSEYEIVKKSL